MATNGFASHSPQELPRNSHGRGKYEQFGREYSQWHREVGTGRPTYLFPVDEIEMDRMDAMHKFFLVARQWQLCSKFIIDLDNLHTEQSPRNPKILDMGCGTGIWALDVAKKFWVPETESYIGSVQAVDKCLDMQPQNIYENSTFRYLDLEGAWDARGSWDAEGPWDTAGLKNRIDVDSKHLIHGRLLAGSIRSWEGLYREACRYLIPGEGWLEQVEIDWDFANDNGPVSPRLQYWSKELLDATSMAGRPLRLDCPSIHQSLAAAGLTNLRQEVMHIRVNGGSTNAWEIDAGRWFNLSLHKGFMGMSLGPLCLYKGWSVEQVENLRNEVLREIGDRNNTSYCRLYIWSAQRPVRTPQ